MEMPMNGLPNCNCNPPIVYSRYSFLGCGFNIHVIRIVMYYKESHM